MSVAPLPPSHFAPDLPNLRDHTADHRMVVLALAVLVVGAGGAAGAWVLLRLIALATNLFWYGRLSADPATMAAGANPAMIVLMPVLGSLIVGLMARYGSEKIRGHGIPEAIETILYGESRLSLKVAILKPLSSAISIGSGGPFGAEGPIIMTGGAIGSLFAQRFHLTAAERKTLLVSGAAAGMTAIFGTPLAAILLAVEVLLFEWKPRSFVPVVLACLVAYVLRGVWLGGGPMFPANLTMPAGFWVLAAALGLGLLQGALAGVLSSALYRVEDGFHRLPVHWMWWPAIGGLVVGLGALIDPRVLGAGYANIQALLDGAMSARAIALLLAVKAMVWLVALGSGTSGGVLAPLLMLGGALGALAGLWLPGGEGVWAMIGMAGIMSGAMRAPLTGALFAAELTGHFEALPLTMACAIGAYGVSVLVMRRSILTEKIARRGRHIRQEYSVDPLELFQVERIMTPAPQTMADTTLVSEALAFFADGAWHRSYPVVNAAGGLVGMVSREDALNWQSGGMELDLCLRDVLSDASSPYVWPQTPIGALADLILETGKGRIPVLSPADGRVVGMVTRHDLLKARQAARADEVVRA
ncbi:MAG: chloride channel protein [Novosphingobium sp. 63-713]|uniref:chloride channel protein n=1 Tax=unclassified Novosphingobium TaxID=2644732 RepID=UPI000967BC4B|nr:MULTISPECIES: chloride channel protein [unclassified Novosphingobium]MBN9144580.1 chloride channel protein [Novosphingobium sp.]OJX93672.1 MAG: chloride channel protein [Novosphingobium sp. 63-713]